ncbi:hypothetical protein [Methyloceanibacter sp.]|uniref:hypothetical protein n=1 Tax=Methyloceanibacter sp. TaxID=1965321 RepID=UPI00208792A2|nr:hypothetical protein [Methyloceanibacter sp.]GFO80576.1 MAG: hypothetical protein A49_02030 [Methyloceanibacter sp.]HML92414.1 hypothetical protein [Methyloceanibacter sp.]
MKLTTLTCAAVALSFTLGMGAAYAEDNALDADACKKVWAMASPDGETLSKDKAVDYVTNFEMVDSNTDAAIDADEFNAACSKGLVKADAATVKDMN